MFKRSEMERLGRGGEWLRRSLWVRANRRTALSGLFTPRRAGQVVISRLLRSILLTLSLLNSSCFESVEEETFYGQVRMPRTQEFRWSDGGLPEIFDPALAAAPPDTDAVRAMFEGLTDYHPRDLSPIPGVAMRWESSPDYSEWIFYLRSDARWSNGDPVTAHDFVYSWERTLRLRERAPHVRLLENIRSAAGAIAAAAVASARPPLTEVMGRDPAGDTGATKSSPEKEALPESAPGFTHGARAVSDYVLKVKLQRPDRNFPALVAHPAFRPVHRLLQQERSVSAVDGKPAELNDYSPSSVITNGPFHLARRDRDGVVLERARHYWGRDAIALERVRFVAAQGPEQALAAYHAGEVDAITNAAFEPLALKLLAPYKDFRRATYGALTYCVVNTSRPPFDDLRVRLALALAIDRHRLSVNTMQGATQPAQRFLPIPVPVANEQNRAANSEMGPESPAHEIVFDIERARQLLAEAGFPGGTRFPKVQFLVTRNHLHRVMAQGIAAMWREALGIRTEVVVREWDDFEAALRSGDYDIARRSMVMQTIDEVTTMLDMFEPPAASAAAADAAAAAAPSLSLPLSAVSASPPSESVQGGSHSKSPLSPTPPAAGSGDAATGINTGGREDISGPGSGKPASGEARLIMSEAQALRELPAIPIYFASSHALVKPYVTGFEMNLLDIASLKYVRINTKWEPPKKSGRIWVVGGE